jgi:hypothetical protein
MPLAALGIAWIQTTGHLFRGVLAMNQVAIASVDEYTDPKTDAHRHNHGHTVTKRRKSVLFCPKCETEGLVDDKWIVVGHQPVGRRPIYECPECSTIVNPRYTA